MDGKEIKYLDHCFDYGSNEFHTFDDFKFLYNVDDNDFFQISSTFM